MSEAQKEAVARSARQNDEIEIDLNACTIKLLVDDATLEERKKNFVKRDIHPVKGVLKSYREKVTGADEGALWL